MTTCACVSKDANQCAVFRGHYLLGNDDPDPDEECECTCHDRGEGEEDLW